MQTDRQEDLALVRGQASIARPPDPHTALLQQIFELDPLACPTFGGPMRILAIITHVAVIDQILTNLRTRGPREVDDWADGARFSPRGASCNPGAVHHEQSAS